MLGLRRSHLTPLRPLRLRPFTQLPPSPVWIPMLVRTHHPPNLKILLMIPEEPLPPRNRLLHLRPRKPNLPLPAHLLLRRRDTPIYIVDRHKHFLNAPQVRRKILLKATRHERARRIAPRKEIVAPARAVDCAVGGDVEDGAVDGEVEGERVVGAVVEG